MQIKKIIIAILCVIALYAFQTPLISDPFEKILSRLESYRLQEAPEKVYVHTDKPYYTNGETIWFKSYLVDGITHTKSNKSNVIYVELIDPKDSIISRRQLYAENRSANGDFEIPKSATEGTYLLRAYTNYMRNTPNPAFFQKEIRVWNQKISVSEISEIQTSELVNRDTIILEKNAKLIRQNKPKLKFYPEGGDLVRGLSSIIGIKATDQRGNGIELEGSIKDETGANVSFFRTFRFGLGSTQFKPEAGKNYYVSVMINGLEETYPIPTPLLSGYVLHVNNTGKDIIIKVQTNRVNGLNGTLLLGHIRGVPILKHLQTTSDHGDDSYTIKLPINSTNANGVAQFTLFTTAGDPVCERLTYITNKEQEPVAQITTKKHYTTRAPATVSFMVKDSEGILLKGDFSMSITEKNNVINDPEAGSIESWLLLDSDLRETIPDPGAFFAKNPESNMKYLLDMVMLTHGWRRFVWKDLLKEKIKKTPAFLPEKGIIISGKTTVLDKPYQPKFSLTSLNFLSESMYHENKYTDKNGRFRFGPYILLDSIKTFIQATDPNAKNKLKEKELSIQITPPIPNPIINRSYKKPMDTKTISYAKRYLAMARRKKIIDYQYDPEATILDEVILKSKTKTKAELINEEIDELLIYRDPRTRIFIDSIAGGSASSILDLIGRAPGVQVRGGINNPQIFIGPANAALGRQPLLLLDGFQISIEQIATMSAAEVSFIDVLDSFQAGILGSNTAGGAIAIYTYRDFNFAQNQQRAPGIIDFVSPGFYKAREFFAPNYYKEKDEHQKPDYRTTLYWDPNVVCNGTSNALINFYTEDAAGEYLVQIEGITNSGVPIKATHSFMVE